MRSLPSRIFCIDSSSDETRVHDNELEHRSVNSHRPCRHASVQPVNGRHVTRAARIETQNCWSAAGDFKVRGLKWGWLEISNAVLGVRFIRSGTSPKLFGVDQKAACGCRSEPGRPQN